MLASWLGLGADIILIGGFWFWALVIVVNIALIALVEFEKAGFSILVLLATLGLFQFASDFNALNWVWHNPWTFAGCTIIYFVLGVLWSFMKFGSYCKRQRRDYDTLKRRFLESKGLGKEVLIVPDELKSDWLKYATEKGPRYDKSYYLRGTDAAEHKGRILNWVGYWPWSFIFTIFNDPIRRICNYLWEWLKDVYAQIAKSAWSGVDKDFHADDFKIAGRK